MDRVETSGEMDTKVGFWYIVLGSHAALLLWKTTAVVVPQLHSLQKDWVYPKYLGKSAYADFEMLINILIFQLQ